MALIDLAPTNSWQEVGEVERKLETFRAAIDEARRNGWHEADHLGDEMDQYLAAVSVDLRMPAAADDGQNTHNNWAR